MTTAPCTHHTEHLRVAVRAGVWRRPEVSAAGPDEARAEAVLISANQRHRLRLSFCKMTTAAHYITCDTFMALYPTARPAA